MNNQIRTPLVLGLTLRAILTLPGGQLASADTLEQQFRELPMEARQLMGPLFWLHGDESKERLQMYVGKVAEGGNGCFTAESRPHNDWLGPNWYRDLGICLDEAKKNNLKMWIFDERWWPSQTVACRVPSMKCLMIVAGLGLMPGIASQAAAKPLQVYILAGQSNMQGHVNVSTLKAGVSNGGYHYLGAARIMAPIGKAFAEAMANLQKNQPKKP